jgi:hypothetical protein
MTIDFADLFKSYVWDVMIKVAIADAMVSLSISPQGWLAMMITKIIIYGTNKLYPYIVRFIKIEKVILQDEIHQKEFEKIQLKLKIIATNKGIDSQEFKDAHKKEQDDLIKLIKFNDGSTSVRIGKN